MKKIKNCVVADDEYIARSIIVSYIQQIPGLRLLKECKDAFEAMEAIDEGNVDLLFLDINMPKLTGLGMLRNLPNRPEVIITTAYPEYAVDGFELSVTDYLLKPFSFERFVQAVQKTAKPAQSSLPVETNETTDFIFVKSDQRLIRVQLCDIRYIEACGNYIFIYTGTDQRIMSKQTLTQFEEELPASFIRIHKSFIVPLARIDYLEGNEVSIASKKLPIGKVFKNVLVDRMKV